jgi:putative tricarboxylic transport membrane protein
MLFSGKGDLLAGIVLASFGGFVIYEAGGLPYHSEFGPGPGFFPLWIGVAIVAGSLIMICLHYFRPGSEETANTSRAELIRALGAWLAFVAAIVLLPLIGFGLSLALLTAFLIIALDRRSSWVALGAALAIALGFHLVFAVALGVSLPAGFLGF